MSAPSRGRGGVTPSRGAAPTSRGRGSYRGNAGNTPRGRGRGRGGGNTGTPTSANNAGLLQKLRSGTAQRASDDGAATTPRGRGISARGQFGPSTRARGSISKTFNTTQPTRATQSPRASSPAPPSSHREFMAHMNEKFQQLKPKRDAERKKAIQDGFLADPEKKTSLANAITPVGTCTEMCPQFERVERIVQNMVDRAEKIPNPATGRDVPSEDRMVKRFRRSAAGYDEQLPSDIRTPETLRTTLDYLLDKVIGGGERLASIHKFVWDRTRGIRNDFSIQQVTKKEDVKIAVECYERIARFHILSLHQLSNPYNLQEGEHFDAHQEREQLNNTLLSLMYYYDDNRGAIPLPNEPEFRAYCILFELQALTPDLEDRMHAWPVRLLNHPKVQTAFKLHAAASNTIMDQGPLRPSTPFSVAQANPGKFWTILSSQAVSYMMACVAEINFGIVRFTALDALWRSAKSSPQGQQARNQEWTLSELQNYLAFDDEDETLEFCQTFDLAFKNNDNGEQCLDFVAVNAGALDKSSIPSQQNFSHGIVEEKRYRRTLVSVINGVGVAAAIRQGLVEQSEPDEDEDQHQDTSMDDQSMFIPEEPVEGTRKLSGSSNSMLNPSAAVFKPSAKFGESRPPSPTQQSTVFGKTFGETSSPPTSRPVWGASSPFPVFGSLFSGSQPSGAAALSQPATSPPQPAANSLFGPGSRLTQPSLSSSTSSGAAQKSSFLPDSKLPIPAGESTFGQTTSQPKVASTGIVFPSGSQTSQSPQHPFSVNASIQDPSSPPGDFSEKIQKLPLFNLPGGQRSKNQEEAKVTEQKPFPGAGPGFTFDKPSAAINVNTIQSPASVDSSANNLEQAGEIPQQQRPAFSFTSPQQPSQDAQPEVHKPASGSLTPTNFAQNDQPTPLFSFPQEPRESEAVPEETQQTFKFPSVTPFEPSTTPQGTPKRPQFGTSRLPLINENRSLSNISRTPAETIEITQHTPVVTNPTETTPTTDQLRREFTKPQFTEVDRIKLVENTSRLILTQPQGLIEYFISHHLSNLLSKLAKDYVQEQHDQLITYVRTRHLSRKFVAIWRARVQRAILSKRAKQRRKLLAVAMQAEQDKKQRDEAELEAILAATQETKRIQEEQQNSINEARSKRGEKLGHSQSPQAQVQAHQIVGQKRKITSTNNSPRAGLVTTQRSWPSHKRSRTVGTVSEPSTSSRFSISGGIDRLSSSILGISRLRQSTNRFTYSADSRPSLSQKVDSTKTDYFKLKAMGIDPNTPLVPDTAKMLKDKKVREQESKETLLVRSKIRPSVFSTLTASRPPSPSMQPPPKPVSTSVQSSPLRSSYGPTELKPSAAEPEEDDFLRQLREARQSLAQDAEWFKTQVTVLEREIDEREELRRSQNSQTNSRHEPLRPSRNGLVRANGYDYYPAEAKSGKSLSRTEERIRRTGAHGLATRAVGSDYVPVAMSRQSASKYSRGGEGSIISTSKKRLRSAMNNSTDLGSSPLRNEITSTSPGTKRFRDDHSFNQTKLKAANTRASLNPYAALQNHDAQDDDEDEEVDEKEDEAYDNHVGTNHNYQNGADGDTEDNEDDLYGDEDIDDDEEEEEDSQQQGHVAHHYALLSRLQEERVYDDDNEEDEEGDEDDDDGTPGTYPHFSRAQSGSSAGLQSGPGASADDALVLSD